MELPGRLDSRVLFFQLGWWGFLAWWFPESARVPSSAQTFWENLWACVILCFCLLFVAFVLFLLSFSTEKHGVTVVDNSRCRLLVHLVV